MSCLQHVLTLTSSSKTIAACCSFLTFTKYQSSKNWADNTRLIVLTEIKTDFSSKKCLAHYTHLYTVQQHKQRSKLFCHRAISSPFAVRQHYVQCNVLQPHSHIYTLLHMFSEYMSAEFRAFTPSEQRPQASPLNNPSDSWHSIYRFMSLTV